MVGIKKAPHSTFSLDENGTVSVVIAGESKVVDGITMVDKVITTTEVKTSDTWNIFAAMIMMILSLLAAVYILRHKNYKM